MNRLFLVNDKYYVVAFDYYDAITKYKNYENDFDEEVVQKIELVTNDIIYKNNVNITSHDRFDDEDEEDE